MVRRESQGDTQLSVATPKKRLPGAGGGFLTRLPVEVKRTVPDLDKTWDESLVTFFNFGVMRFFLDAKRFVYVFLVQS